MNITVKSASLASLKAAIEGTTRKLKSELRIAVNATAAKSKSILNKEIRTELALPAKAVNSLIAVKRKASGDNISSTVEVKKSKRPPITQFSHRQTKAGVSAKISKTRPRTVIKSGFKVAKWGGQVVVRTGKERGPLRTPRGPSPVGVLLKGKKLEPSLAQTEAELIKQVERRVRFITLKKTGAI